MTERSSEGLDVRRRKLLFRAWRRGVREMDLIIGRSGPSEEARLSPHHRHNPTLHKCRRQF